MLNKMEMQMINNMIGDKGRNIARAIESENTASAFAIYDTTRDFLQIFNKGDELDNYIKYRLNRKFTEDSISLFMTCFKASFIDYKDCNNCGYANFGILKLKEVEELKAV